MLRAYAGTLAVVVIPGLLVAAILGLRLRRLLTWAAIPAFSIAVVFVLGELTLVFRVPFGLPAFAVLLAVLAGVLAFVALRRTARVREEDASDDSARIEARFAQPTAYVLLALGIALGALTWYRGLHGIPLIPPGSDATRHGWLVARIMYGHTFDLAKIYTWDAAGTHSLDEYYPIGLHACVALSTKLAGSDVGRVFVVYIVVFSAAVLPLGMFVLARVLAPSRPLVAGFTALVVPLLVLFPYWHATIGDPALVVATAMVPVAVVLLFRTMSARHPPLRPSRALVVALLPAALATLSIISVHTSELPLLAFLPILLLLERAWRTHDLRMVWPALARGAAVGAMAIALFVPTLVEFAHGVAARAPLRQFVAQSSTNWESSLGAVLQLNYPFAVEREGALTVLALAGAALCLLWRRPAWVAGWGSIVLLVLFTDTPPPNTLANELTLPWYHLGGRVVPYLAFFVPFFAGVTLAYAAVVITRVVKRSWAIFPATVVMIAFLGQFAGFHGYRAVTSYVQAAWDPDSPVYSAAFPNQALVDHGALAVFEYLHDHVAPGDTVVNEPVADGSIWMYAQQDVAPLIGIPFARGKIAADLADRLYLVDHVARIGGDSRAAKIARHFRAHWVFSSTKQLGFLGSRMDLDSLMRSPDLSLAFHKGDAYVFRIRRLGPPSK